MKVKVNLVFSFISDRKTGFFSLVIEKLDFSFTLMSSYPSMTKLKIARNQYDAELAIQGELRQKLVQMM